MKIRRILSVFLLTVLMVSLMLTPQAYALPALEIKAKAAVLVDADEGRIIFGQNEQEREYPASITKVMTALLTLEAVDAGKLSLDQPITASAVVNDQDPEGSSAGIEEGEVLTVEQLLYCLLLVSANEAADILAETVSGSREAFVELMNQRAQELGCTGTHFANTNGLHDVNHYTTAYDIYLFFREAMKHETFMTITGSVAYEVPATNKSEARELHTTNSLLSNWRILDYLYDGVDCGKTGSTPEAGYCLVSSCLRDGKRLVAVVLGAEGEGTHIESFSESARLYDYGYNNFSKQLVVSTEDVFRQPVALSKETDCVMLYPAENAEAFLPSDVTKDQLEQTVTLKNEVADAPITRGQEMGTLTISYNGQVCVTVPLLAQADVSASRFLVAKAAVEEFLSRTIVKVALVVLVLLVILLVLFSVAGSPSAPVVSGYLPGAEDIRETGLLPGDEFYRIDGHRIYFQSDAILFLGRAGEDVAVEVLRDGRRLDLGTLHLPYRTLTDESGQQSLKRGVMVGELREAGPLGTLRNAWYQSIDYVRTVWLSLGDLIRGAVSLNDMAGPIGIFAMAGEVGQQGAAAAGMAGALLNIFSFVALIAINLAVMNLLPIPALDGGQILFLLVGGIYHFFTHRRIDQKYLGYINMAGFFCLIALMVVVAVSDVNKLIL